MGEYRFSSLLKQNKKAKICFVIYIAGFFFLKKFCYEVFAKQKKIELPRLYYLRFNRSTQMAHTPTNKPELGSIVRKQFCIALHASRCLNKHLTGAPSAYTPLLVLGPAPHDPRVHKPTIRQTRMTRVRRPCPTGLAILFPPTVSM